MATYKVPQDVEAEDKLLGPLSFRQFIYALIAVGGVGLAVLLYRLSPLLVVIPLPITILFGALALPLRKDQPMEIYLLAVIRYALRPHIRLWTPDGVGSLVEIEAPVQANAPLAHSLTSEMAERRLEYLSQIMDSRGWSFKHATRPTSEALHADVATEVANAPDILDDNNDLAKSFDKLLTKKSEEQRKSTLETMREAAQAVQKPSSVPNQVVTPAAPAPLQPQSPSSQSQEPQEPTLHFNPYPTIHQRIVQPYSAAAQPKPVATPSASVNPTPPTASVMTPPVSPGIIRLAHNDDLSISAIAREAHRLQGDNEGEEVIISLHKH
jgi:hypothetical protein